MNPVENLHGSRRGGMERGHGSRVMDHHIRPFLAHQSRGGFYRISKLFEDLIIFTGDALAFQNEISAIGQSRRLKPWRSIAG
jgi:hypothetical protein